MTESSQLAVKPTLSARRALLILLVYFLLLELPAFLISVGIGAKYAAEGDAAVINKLTSLLPLYAIPITVIGISVGGLVAFAMARRALRNAELGVLGFKTTAPHSIATAAMLGAAIGLLYLFVFIPISPPVADQQWGPLTTAAGLGGWQTLLWILLAIAIAPPVEEFIFRGVLLSGLAQRIGIALAAILVTGLFVIIHAAEALTYWPAWAGISLVALTTLFFRLQSGSLLPAIATHAGYNSVLAISVFSSTA